MVKRPIYFDYMATTPVDPRVIQKMIQYMGPDGIFGNAASVTHEYGLKAAEAVARARQQVADVIGASPEEIVFTSGATEAINLAILGSARFYQRKGKHVITVSTEHKAVLDSFKQLERENFTVTYLKPLEDGLISFEELKKAVRPDTILVSVMHVNNEIGVIQDIQAIGEYLKDKGVVFHVDAAQSIGKLPIRVRDLAVNLMSFSAHKNYGPKGVGGLFVRQKPRTRLSPLSYGGGQEGGLRAGTLATHQIVGMGEAFFIAEKEREQEQARILKLRRKLWHGIKHLPFTYLNGSEEQRVAGNLNITFKGLAGEDILIALKDLAISTLSACSSAVLKASYVLQAIGLSEEDAHSSIRIAIGRFTTEEDIDRAIQIINQEIPKLREMSGS
ncbi:cysteine desulfurase NifS (plasmid) [Legionella adelaidensis]|uniref:cysteine desulfurase n=1 Tax=Legionella adelaidensis TaxID=45056 RepID=A0A0W0R4V4_9GAMM|nr:IscS subfamily cysteine desulfurase [Legionella adelaidensis]KTC66113.1 cysteine desulfurase NifS [Legionella adelaidensis]VEH85817.1 cysteine desulfurase NifS [Legionella adelaidensis]